MAGKVLNFKDISLPDQLGTQIARSFHEWDILRSNQKLAWSEIRKYVYATDTTTTSNSKLPWKNKTTIPKMCQVNDNLFANYKAAMFPKRRWLFWEADNKDDAEVQKRDSILDYMGWTIQQPRFEAEFDKMVLDYIQCGNAFATVEWIDERIEVPSGSGKTKTGYCGPAPRRISPLDIVFNPTAPSFTESPKIVRSILSMGELKKKLESLSNDENRTAYEALFKYLKDIRVTVRNSASDLNIQDDWYRVDGFTSFRSYLESDYVEVLTFYGDIYDWTSEKLLTNRVIMIADRHKIISNEPNPSYFGFPPIFHVGWRVRQDNLWGMSPLANLVGMQYRVDQVENLKADVFDLIAYPVLKIKGYVEDFVWQPLERIFVGDEGDVEMLAPPFQALQANVEIKNYMDTMEEMAGSPKEAMGFRTPGEKTAYEVQRLENAAARIFNNKIVQFEVIIERTLNAMLELARRNLSEVVTITAFDDDFNIQTFATLSAADITGSGRIKPVAARNFAEKSEMVQNLNNFFNSALGQDPTVKVHFSSLELAKLFEELLEVRDYGLVQPYVRISEQADAQRRTNAAQQQTQMEAQTPSGLTPDDVDNPHLGGTVAPPQPLAAATPPQAAGKEQTALGTPFDAAALAHHG